MQWPEYLRARPIEQWPGELTRSRQPARFDSTWSSTLTLLGRELRAITARNAVLQVALREADFRIDGYPRAQAKAEHPGVILSLDSKHGPLSWPCDTFTTWQDNVRAIALAMEALRKVDRYGVTKRGEQYTGWRAIESGASGSDAATAEQAIDTLRVWAMRGGVKADPDGYYSTPTLAKYARRGAHPDRHDGDRGPSDEVLAAMKVLGLL